MGIPAIVHYFKTSNLYLFVASSVLFLLIVLDLSTLFVPLNIYINTVLIVTFMIFASFLLSLELINFNDLNVIFFALILIANVLHIISFYSLIPIGVFGDQRVQNVDLIVRSGRTAGGESSEDPYYGIFPAFWLISSILNIIIYGFIGSHVVDRLVSDGWNVRVLDNFSNGRMKNIEHQRESRKVEILKGDLKNLEEVKKTVRDIDVVFHYAANPEVRVSTTNPEIHLNENIVATFNLLEAMEDNQLFLMNYK